MRNENNSSHLSKMSCMNNINSVSNIKMNSYKDHILFKKLDIANSPNINNKIQNCKFLNPLKLTFERNKQFYLKEDDKKSNLLNKLLKINIHVDNLNKQKKSKKNLSTGHGENKPTITQQIFESKETFMRSNSKNKRRVHSQPNEISISKINNLISNSNSNVHHDQSIRKNIAAQLSQISLFSQITNGSNGPSVNYSFRNNFSFQKSNVKDKNEIVPLYDKLDNLGNFDITGFMTPGINGLSKQPLFIGKRDSNNNSNTNSNKLHHREKSMFIKNSNKDFFNFNKTISLGNKKENENEMPSPIVDTKFESKFSFKEVLFNKIHKEQTTELIEIDKDKKDKSINSSKNNINTNIQSKEEEKKPLSFMKLMVNKKLSMQMLKRKETSTIGITNDNKINKVKSRISGLSDSGVKNFKNILSTKLGSILISNNVNIKKKFIKSTLVRSISCPNIDGSERINQDAFTESHKIFGLEQFSIFSVFDGHGQNGHLISENLSHNLVSFFSNIDLYPRRTLKEIDIYNRLKSNNYELIKNSYLKCHSDLSFLPFDCSLSGSTAVTAIVIGKKLICANVGDSRGLMVLEKIVDSQERYVPIQISRDHKPNIPAEKTRIKQNGGVVHSSSEGGEDGSEVGPVLVWKKNTGLPGLRMSRSIGDNLAKTIGVIAEPEIFEYDIIEDSKIIVLATGGVWKNLSNIKLMDIIMSDYKTNNISRAGDKIIDDATKGWKRDDIIVDDITFIIIFLG